MSSGNNNAIDSLADDLQESPMTENGEAVMILARAVGVLVAIVAVLMWIMLMTVFRAFLVWMISMWGVIGVSIFVALCVVGAMKYGKMSDKLIWTMLQHSCS